MRKLRKVIGLCAAIGAAVLVAAGCTERSGEQQPVRAFAQRELVIGLIPEQNIFEQRERHQALGRYLSKKLGITVHFTSLSRYGSILDRFQAEKMDGAFFGSYAYVLAHSRLGLEPLVRPVNPDGTSTYHGYLIVRKDSGILSAADMRGKRFAFVDRATTAGYVFPLAYLRQHGIADPLAFLGESFFAGSYDAAVFAVLDRQADIGGAKNTIFERLARENGRVRSELRIVGTSGVVPQNCLAVRKDLDADLKAALSAALLGMDRDPEANDALRQFGARGFIATADADYDYVYALAVQAGMDVQRPPTAARADRTE
jgi:phosphonate transport system substrate-binding protein